MAAGQSSRQNPLRWGILISRNRRSLSLRAMIRPKTIRQQLLKSFPSSRLRRWSPTPQGWSRPGKS